MPTAASLGRSSRCLAPWRTFGGAVLFWSSTRVAGGRDVLVQYGVPRTATTFQFQTLCAVACLQHGADRLYCGTCSGALRKKQPRDRTIVCKTHSIDDARRVLAQFPDEGRFFTTGCNATALEETCDDAAWRPTARAIEKRLNLTPTYVQVVDLLQRRGHFLVRDFRTVFGLTSDETDALLAYARFWDELRVCCGQQMSADYVARLAGRPSLRSEESPGFDACETVNVGAVERRLVETSVFRQCARRVPQLAAIQAAPRGGSVATPVLDGRYCERMNAKMAAHLAPVARTLANNESVASSEGQRATGCSRFASKLGAPVGAH